MMKPFRVCLWALFLVLSACAASPRMDGDSGAKKAYITRIYTPETLPQERLGCFTQISPEDLKNGRIVEVKYGSFHKMIYRFAVLPDSLQANLYDEVEVLPGNCADGQMSRITKRLQG